MGEAKPKKRKMSHKESFLLTSWYEKNKDAFQQLPDNAVAAKAEEVVGVQGVRDVHIQGVRATLGIAKRAPNTASAAAEDIEGLQCLLNECNERLQAVERNHQGLLDRVRKLETTR